MHVYCFRVFGYWLACVGLDVATVLQSCRTVGLPSMAVVLVCISFGVLGASLGTGFGCDLK